MITLINGNKYRTSLRDPITKEGYILDADGKTFIQQYLPCKYRHLETCSTCPKTKKSKKYNSCTLKKIKGHLTCVGCSERKQAVG